MKELSINRREFLRKSIYAAGVGVVGGKVAYDTIKNAVDEHNEYKIYNELKHHVYDVIASGVVQGKDVFNRGKGVVVNDRLITCAHITNIGTQQIQAPFGGMFTIHSPVQEKYVSINGTLLEEIVFDAENDIAVYTNRNPLPRRSMKSDERFYMDEPNFPCEPSEKRELGDEVYMIGNPTLQGLNVRKGKISDLDGLPVVPLSKKCFGIDLHAIPGDSGTPVVSKDFKLLGLTSLNANGLAYVLKIEEFFK